MNLEPISANNSNLNKITSSTLLESPWLQNRTKTVKLFINMGKKVTIFGKVNGTAFFSFLCDRSYKEQT